MKQFLVVLFLFNSYSQLSVAGDQKTVLGTVESVTGTAFLIEIGSEKKNILSKGQPVYEGIVIQTEKNSQVILKLSNGILKLIPSESKISLLTKDMLEIYKKTDESAKKMTATLGTKASKNNDWIEDEIEFLKKIKKSYLDKNYLSVVKQLEKYKGKLSLPENLFIAAYSYLKIGSENQSLTYFNQLSSLKIEEYQDKAYFGLFLNYLRLDKKKEAQDIYLLFQKEYPESEFLDEMKKLME